MTSFHATIDTTIPRSLDLKSVQSFAEFYPFYLTEHRNRTCRALHFVGSSLCLGCLGMLFISGQFLWLFAAVVSVYSCAWIGKIKL
jgi:hypothetical protein